MATTKTNKFEKISDNKIEKIGDMIIAMLEKGKNAEWKKPWLAASSVRAMNFAYNKPFTGVNDFFLNLLCSAKEWKTPYFLTMNQIKELGLNLNVIAYLLTDGNGSVIYNLPDGTTVTDKEVRRLRARLYALKQIRRKKQSVLDEIDAIKQKLYSLKTTEISISLYERLSDAAKAVYKPIHEGSYPVFQFHYNHYDADGEKIPQSRWNIMTEEERAECKSYPSLMAFDEWNIDQTDMSTAMPDKYQELLAKSKGDNPDVNHEVNASDPVLDLMIEGGKWRCPISFGGDRAFYSPANDCIKLPERKQFFTASSFYGTALHEMAHSNKPETKRDYKSQGFYSEGYATEELVAELTAAIMCHDLGIEKTIDDEHIAYVNSWMKACRDKNVIRTILNDLMTSVRYGMGYYETVKSSAKDIAA